MQPKLPTWNLKDLYQSNDDPKIEKDLKKLNKLCLDFAKKYDGKILKISASNLGKAIEGYESIKEIAYKLISYAYLQYAIKITYSKKAAFYQNIDEKLNDINSKILFFTLQINNISDAKIKEHIKKDKLVAKYQPFLRDIRSFKPYQLDEKTEELFHERNLTAKNSWHRLFDEIMADMKVIIGKKQVSLNDALNDLSNKKEKIRKTAAFAISDSLKTQSKTLSLIHNNLAKDKAIEDKHRGFKEPISSRNLDNLIEDEVTLALIDTVKDNYKNLSHKYYKLKAKWLGKKHLNYWDRNAPLPKADDKYIKFEKAQEIVLNAYNEFSPKMANIAKDFFDKNWIDAAISDGKDSGAFSHPTVPSVHPYILMNYQGKVRDIMTLAHELGHGVHQVLSAKQGTLMADTPLTLAETASVFGEQLTFRSILNLETSEQKRKIIKANKIEDMLNTVVRQIAFCDFEIRLHDKRKNGEVSIDKINKIWMDVQTESLGPAIKLDDSYKYYWGYIPHFVHTPFYVYAYAFGDCLVNSLYNVYVNNKDGFEEKYLNMLSMGGTLRHKELLKPFGLDASKKDFWQRGLNMISNLINEIE